MAGSVLVPDSFRTQDQVMVTATPTVSRSNESHTGQFSAAIQSVYLSPGVGMSGQLHYGRMTNTGGSIRFFGWPCNDRPNVMHFWYKYSRNGNDTAQASVTLTRSNNGVRETVGRGLLNIFSSSTSYQEAEVAIAYFSSAQADSITISFVSSSNLVPTPGTVFYVDDISFDDLSASIKSRPTTTTVVYPNPTTDISTVKFSYSGLKVCTLFDATGKKVGSFLEPGMSHLIDFYSIPKGIYYLLVENDGRKEQVTIIRE